MTKSILLVLLLTACAAPVYAQDDPPPTRRELDLTLQAVRSQKDKYFARMELGQNMVNEAKERLPELLLREKDLLAAIKQMEATAKQPNKASK